MHKLSDKIKSECEMGTKFKNICVLIPVANNSLYEIVEEPEKEVKWYMILKVAWRNWYVVVHKLLFLEIYLWFYFSFSGFYRNKNKGVIKATINNDIYAFKRYHIDHGFVLPLIHYRAVDDILYGFKPFSKT